MTSNADTPLKRTERGGAKNALQSQGIHYLVRITGDNLLPRFGGDIQLFVVRFSRPNGDETRIVSLAIDAPVMNASAQIIKIGSKRNEVKELCSHFSFGRRAQRPAAPRNAILRPDRARDGSLDNDANRAYLKFVKSIREKEEEKERDGSTDSRSRCTKNGLRKGNSLEAEYRFKMKGNTKNIYVYIVRPTDAMWKKYELLELIYFLFLDSYDVARICIVTSLRTNLRKYLSRRFRCPAFAPSSYLDY